MPKFDTGAVRSDDAENEAYYLISPIAWARLARVYAFVSDDVFGPYDDMRINLNECLECLIIYLRGNQTHETPEDDQLGRALMYLFEALQIQETGKTTPLYPTPEEIIECYEERYDAISPVGLRRLAERYRIGEKKYSAYNCEKGFPVHDLLNHAIRHLKMHFAGKEDEPGDDNLGGVAWNICMAMHSEEMWPDLNKGHLRGPNCTLTPEILEAIDLKLKSKKDIVKPKPRTKKSKAQIFKGVEIFLGQENEYRNSGDGDRA